VAEVFGAQSTDTSAGNGPLAQIADRDSLARYLRSHFLPAEIASQVHRPITLTKRGCFVTAVKTSG
jgi:hypothetical protein